MVVHPCFLLVLTTFCTQGLLCEAAKKRWMTADVTYAPSDPSYYQPTYSPLYPYTVYEPYTPSPTYDTPYPPSPTYDTPYPPSPTYDTPYPPSPTYHTPYPPSPTYDTLYPPSPTYHTPYPPSPTYDTLYPPSPTYHTPYPPSPTYDTPYPPSPMYDTPYPPSPTYDTPYPPSPTYDTPYPPSPTYDTPYPPSPTYETPYPPSPTYDTPYPPSPTYDTPYTPSPTYDTSYPPSPTYDTPYPPSPTYDTPYPMYRTPYPTYTTPYLTYTTPYPTYITPYPKSPTYNMHYPTYTPSYDDKDPHGHMTYPWLTYCDPYAYRSLNGTCNNLKHPHYGAVGQPFLRLLRPAYRDGHGTPRMLQKDGGYLPSARQVSNAVFSSSTHCTSHCTGKHTIMLASFGQLICHDTSRTTHENVATYGFKDCCDIMPANSTHPQVYRYPCYPIYIDKKYDRHYHDRNCMSFVRSRAATVNGLRQQINKNTAFLDGSAIYGSDENESKKLRARSGGRLKTDRRGRLPKSDVKNCIVNNKRDYCMLAGDKRSNVYPPLGAMHTIFVRYHNYIAGELAIHLFDASNELLFQEARKIVIAVLQRITLKEFLPRLLKGSSVPDHLLHGNYTYNDACDATLFNVMPVVAFRFGHSMVPNYLSMDCQFRLPLTDTFLNPHLVLRNVDSVLKESATDHALSMDNYFSHGIQNEFPTSPNNPTHRDILSFNIQRGRDHGLPPYNQWRRLCHLPAYTRFSQFYYGADGFRKVYRHVDDVDPFPGFMTEKRAGVLGDTLICLLTRQFEKIRFCDRYWWENPHYGITSEILRKEIDKTLLSHVICLTSGVYDIQRHVFRAPNNRTNALLPCQRVLKSAMDVRLFAFLSERKGK